jgi:hypothetical protein
MRKGYAVIASVAIAVSLVITEIIITYLFPRFDIAGLFLVSVLIIGVPVVIGVLSFYLLQAAKSKVNIAFTIIGLVIAAFLIQISLNPSHPNPWVEIARYSGVFSQYPDGTEYEDLAFGNDQEQVAAYFKYQDALPDKMAIIEIISKHDYTVKGRYYIELRNNTVSYNAEKISLVEEDNSVLFITNPYNSERKEYRLQGYNIDSLFELYRGAGIPFEDEWLNQSAHDLKLSTGAEKVFYQILSFR